MTSMTIQAVHDAASGQFYAEVYAVDSQTPVFRTDPAFSSAEELTAEVLKMCQMHFPDHAPVTDDPTIGV